MIQKSKRARICYFWKVR